MKIAVDACLPQRLFKELPNILKINNLEIILIEKYGEGTADIEWFAKYAREDGKYFLSNDINITRNKAELDAYRKHELVGIFMPKNWSSLRSHQQAALIFIKWMAIMQQFENARAGEVFILKYNMSDSQKPFKKLGL